jgi:flagellar hook-associated protein 3 FlgL
MYRVQEQVTTGKRMLRASDDPIGAATSMEARSSLRALEQYRRGVEMATNRTATEETVLTQLSDLLIRAKELGMAFGSDNVSPDQRQAAAIEVESLLKQAVSLGNSRFGEGYLFGGTGPIAAPYDTTDPGTGLTFTTTSPTGTAQIEVSPTHTVDANHNGVEVFEDSGVLQSLQEMGAGLRSADRDAIITSLSGIDRAFASIQDLLGAVGSRSSSLQIAGANLDALHAGLVILKSDVEDVEMEQAITELMSRQTSYQAALLTTSKLMGLTLTDYLR